MMCGCGDTDRSGGQVFHMAFPSFMPACEMADLANKASDVKGRPSTPIELVKVKFACYSRCCSG